MTNAEIQVGEYVRTKNGIIRKAEEVLKGNYVNIDDGFFDNDYDGYRWGLEPDEIKAHSFNLIDLIEVGDYVNGSFIIRAAKDCVDDEGTPIILAEDYDEWSDNGVIYNEDIKTIVTHERFKAMEYKVGGEE